ncbi:hypothetical protein GQX73_g2805 [Xylaria multiplex]|uniref:Rhodopsin domain-containing protein n=1 Tax=Xylaria multiplex TaxID=323545 RepID=A0A7C8IWJ5_9PEZI|nr:hypothetical protein GQX73_g2805 [Xylaria multiplex]
MGISIQGAHVVIVAFITTPLAIVALGLRLWSRRLQKVALGFNDYMAIQAMIFAAATVSVVLAGKIFLSRAFPIPLTNRALDVFIGATGAHMAEIQATEPGVFTLFITLFIPAQILWAVANTSVKLSILSLYTILFPGQLFRRICYATMAISVAYFISVFLGAFLLCQPVQYNWNKTIPNGKCYNQGIAYLLSGIANLLIDAFIVVLPMRKLYRLQVPFTKRIVIGAMFGLGALICIFSLLRIISVLSWDLTDSTYTGSGVAAYSILEPTLGVVNACLPLTRPALKKLLENSSSGWAGKSLRYYGSSSTEANVTSTNGNPDHQHQFRRLEDNIPLTDVRPTNSQHCPL